MLKLLLCDVNSVETDRCCGRSWRRSHRLPSAWWPSSHTAGPGDPVAAWRHESSQATLRFLQRMLEHRAQRAAQVSR